ncbi:MAG: UvrD-helicase domain-containing protein, partial [Chlamydiia bacterium]|nr:UvrD-helicase domain-containing protein [Chlamydiia bacterium]
MTEKTTELNKEQHAAVAHIEGPLLILAGAGSGKTSIVTRRIAHLIDMGVPSAEILGLTFTNKAAGEMKRRVMSMTQRDVLTCTFHSLAARILRESIFHLGYKNDYTIYDADDSFQLIKNCLKTLEIKEEKGLAKSMQGAISNAKNELLEPKDMPEGNDKLGKTLKEVYVLYQQKLQEYNAL